MGWLSEIPAAPAPDTPHCFIVCDKRDDINRVPVEPDRLTQWQSTPDTACDFVADCLGLRPSRRRTGRTLVMEIGMAAGEGRRQMTLLHGSSRRMPCYWVFQHRG